MVSKYMVKKHDKKNMIKKIVLTFFVFILFCDTNFALDNDKELLQQKELLQKEYSFDVVVIDPGHGGSDVGAISKNGLYEKEITLKIAARLKSLIQEDLNLKVKVYLTREDDKYVSLRARAMYANEKNADVFLSIHANSSKYLSISGCETFFYEKDASDEQARLLAELENKGALKDNNEPENTLEFILMDMAKSELIELSYNFADIIQKEYVKNVKSRDRGVKQAPFIVLEGAQMPAVLTEIGFLTSKKDENKFQDKGYLENIAKALFKSVKSYKDITDIKNGKMTKAKEVSDK
jgi:N-acetylmuramoyl-L-alanine amidase